MKYIFLLFLFSLSANSMANQPVILILGDSLSAAYGIKRDAGWINLLQSRLKQQGYAHQVINASISGDTTAGGLSRLPQALKKFNPKIVVIELGANDGLRGLSLKKMQANLSKTIQLAHAAESQVLLLGMMLPPNFGKAYAGKFQQAFQILATDKAVSFVPFFMENVVDKPDLMQADNIHPAAGAQPIMLDNVWPTLQALVK